MVDVATNAQLRKASTMGVTALTLPPERSSMLGGLLSGAYRRTLRATRENHPAWHATYAAFREILPDMPEAQAKLRPRTRSPTRRTIQLGSGVGVYAGER
jgi:hypothetical protein